MEFRIWVACPAVLFYRVSMARYGLESLQVMRVHECEERREYFVEGVWSVDGVPAIDTDATDCA